MSLTLRHEAPADRRAVETLVREAFWNVYKPGCDEHYYLHLLRQSPAFRPELTFVCEADGVLAGQIACASSSIELEAGGYLDTVTFGPLAVLPSFQGKGLARALVRSPALRPLRLLVRRALGHLPGERPVPARPPGSGAGPRLPGKRRRALPRGLCLCPRRGRAGRF